MKLKQVCISSALAIISAIAFSVSAQSNTNVREAENNADGFRLDLTKLKKFSLGNESEKNNALYNLIETNNGFGETIYESDLGDSGFIRTRTNSNNFFESHKGDSVPKIIIDVGTEF